MERGTLGKKAQPPPDKRLAAGRGAVLLMTAALRVCRIVSDSPQLWYTCKLSACCNCSSRLAEATDL